ncbi:hypothetical protein [Streptomyces sp. NBC_01373]|nr:hypothetical protein [Streptomyces sp. NBC_01373]MCX4706050.1 hypothetical protein [Streptomyces sp. NBC_01373]
MPSRSRHPSSPDPDHHIDPPPGSTLNPADISHTPPALRRQ